MASRAIVAPNPKEEGVKQKNAQPEGKNRRVLRDIGNLVTVPAAEGKPQNQIRRPITRTFCQQLLANAQAAAEEKNKKPLAEVANGGGAVRVNVARKHGGAAKVKQHEQPKPLEISPDKEEDKKPVTVSDGRKLGVASSRKKGIKTLTSILSARSKEAAAAAAGSGKPIVNIDAADAYNELAVVEYVDDMYKFYKMSEDESRVHDYMDSQPEINAKMRSILIDWLAEVHRKFELMPETLYLTINIVDRYLSMKTVPRKELQLLGIGSMLIACKYEEIWAPEVNDFVAISDNAYAREQILVMEKAILGRLEWHLTVPTPYVFLARYTKASVPADQEPMQMENMVFFLAELGLLHYHTVTLYCASMIAAAAVYAARCTLDRKPHWTGTLEHHTGYSEEQLRDCAKLLVSFHLDAVESSKLRAVFRKYSSPERGSVASLRPAMSLLALVASSSPNSE
ncbi:G2/mitotic-specific cyclin S13-7 isoform X2 [Diospyros lotus]|uniref:G2/mitotic-specific cyclin S13-7 isoform X2 n=1 Tax=Diospyros lotus TaxID=55363 RepID=UPI00224CA273|nr:G2/mitotic-specific cyclin S13-7 isoform X2 [Diospyros lotus]